MALYGSHGTWFVGKCKNCRIARSEGEYCLSGTSRTKCGRCISHKLECSFDIAEETEAARNPQSCLPDNTGCARDEGPNAFRALRWSSEDDFEASPRAHQDVKHRLLEIGVISRIEMASFAEIIWRMEYHLVGGVLDQWCRKAAIPGDDWGRVYLTFKGVRLDERKDFAIVVKDLENWSGHEVVGNKKWLEVILEAKMEEAQAAPIRTYWRDRGATHEARTLDGKPEQDKHTGGSVETPDEGEVSEADSISHSDDTVRQKISIQVSLLLPGTSSLTLDFGWYETAHQVLKSWYKKQSQGFEYKRRDLWLACGDRILRDNMFCSDIWSQALTLCGQVHPAGDVEGFTSIWVMTYPEVQAFLDLRRRTIEAELRRVEAEQKIRGPYVDRSSERPPAIDTIFEPETEPRSFPELCNGIYAAITEKWAGVRLIVRSQEFTILLITFYRKTSEKVEELLTMMDRLYPFPDTGGKKLVAVRRGNVLDRFATWWSVSESQERYTSDSERTQAKPIYLDIMTEKSFESLATEKKNKDARFLEELLATGDRSTPVLGKRQRESSCEHQTRERAARWTELISR